MIKTILKRLKNYQDLFLILAWREFNIRYKQTVLGVLWAILQPLIMMLLFTIVFTFFIPVKVTHHPYPIFFYSGLIFWTFFVVSIHYSIPCLKNNYTLITRIYFPKEAIVYSGIAVAFIDMLIAFVILLILTALYNVPISFNILWAVPLIILLLIFTISISLILSALNVFYKDVALASNFLIQVWFFTTPVMYNLDTSNPKLHALLFINPLAFIITNLRHCLIDNAPVDGASYLLMLVLLIGFLLLSYKFFLTAEKKIADAI